MYIIECFQYLNTYILLVNNFDVIKHVRKILFSSKIMFVFFFIFFFIGCISFHILMHSLEMESFLVCSNLNFIAVSLYSKVCIIYPAFY